MHPYQRRCKQDDLPVDAFFRSCDPLDIAAWCSSLHAASMSLLDIYGCIGWRSSDKRVSTVSGCSGMPATVLDTGARVQKIPINS